ncbi:MAG: conjugal transfer protein TraD [Rhodocyclaceae bacterium]|nr:conjugal transfer protein TraD [Rhodocyclaceae bacterium]
MTTQEHTIEDERAATLEVALEKLHDAYTTPGLEVPFDPDEAELVGAFEEDAMSYEDSIEGAIDLPDAIRADGEEQV